MSARKSSWMLFCLTLMLCWPNAAWASTGAPWETVLQKIIDSLTGPVARLAVVGAIAMFGIGLAIVEGPVMRRLIQIIFGLSLASGAAVIAALLFPTLGSGATF